MKKSFSPLVLAAALSTLALLAAGPGASAPTATAVDRAKVSVSRSPLGSILVDGRGRTLYLFEKDKRGRSSCAGACATYWPPLLTHGSPTVGRGVKRSLLGVTRRGDGSTQVTYAGHPLYRFVQDRRAGRTSGQDSQAFGAGWYVLSAAGKKIEKDSH
jgi:predicted lipoprotein with Yx(FWY)xxD motif